MKTAVSLPDPVFEAAEKLAKRMKLSRSALYARAIEDYVLRSEPDDVTEEINRALDGVPTERDSFVNRAASDVLRRAVWK